MGTLYVMGAGSSVEAGAPSIATFKETAMGVLGQLRGKPGEKMFQSAIDYWNSVVPRANIEEYYVLLDLLERLNLKSHGPTAFFEVGPVKYLIAKTLELSMGTKLSDAHTRFAHRAWDLSGGHKNITAISLNWDIALDRVAYSTHTQFSLNYGCSKAAPLQSGEFEGRDGLFTILKLHGSTNWWFCGKCGTLWYSMASKEAPKFWEYSDPPKCRIDDSSSQMEPLMIPPTGQKFESTKFKPILLEVWTKAREALSQCDALAFVGYSFPPTDLQFKMLVHEALSTNNRLAKIVVVTSPKYGTEKMRFEDHYSEVFQGTNHKNKLSFRYMTFNQWIEQDNCSI